MFYTNGRQSGTIVPRFGSLAEYRSAIDEKQKAIDALHKKQYHLMLQNDVSDMASLDEPIKASEKDLDGLKTGMDEGIL